MSAPARARLEAVRASNSREGSLSTSIAFFGFNDHPAVAVAGVLAEADVGDENKFFGGGDLFDCTEALLNDAVVVPGAGGLLIFFVGQAKEQKAANAQPRPLLQLRGPLRRLRD